MTIENIGPDSHESNIAQRFGQFLREKNLVAERYRTFHVHWVDRFLQEYPQSATAIDLASVQKFLECLGRQKLPWQVRQAEDAIRLFGRFQDQDSGSDPKPQTAPTDTDGGSSAWPATLANLSHTLRLKHRSLRTERSYLGWVRRFQDFMEGRDPSHLQADDVRRFLTHLAVDGHVAAATQNQAFNSILFLFRHVIGRDLEGLEETVRAPMRLRLPVILTRDECQRILRCLAGTYQLMARVIYGSGLRLQECLELRIKDVDLDRHILTVRSGKGDKDRRTVLPECLDDDWSAHKIQVRALYEEDRARGSPGVALPHALEHKYPGAGTRWEWFWAFPAPSESVDPRSRIVRRHHVHPSALQKQFRRAVQAAAVEKPASVHSLRHAFATHLIEAGQDIRTIQELMGHKDVQTTMIYTHVAQKRRLGVHSPLDGLAP